MMPAPQFIYSLGSLIFICYLTNRAKNKWFLFAILFWLLSTPILEDPRYTISLNFVGIDLQPSRILFLFLLTALCFFIIRTMLERKPLLEFTIHRLRFYELWMVIYICVAILIIAFNVGEIGARAVIVNIIKLSTFLMVYFFARECITPQDFSLLTLAIVIFALFSSLAGTYQFFGDSSFFRIGAPRAAFGSYIRASGFFAEEYEQGIFLTMALSIGMITIQSKWYKAFIIAILPFGVFFTMHRASWVILVIAFGTIAIREFRNAYLWIFISAMAATIVFFVVLNLPQQWNYPGGFLDQLTSLRLRDNTWEARLSYDQFAIDMIQKYPLGIGDYASSTYSKEAYSRSMEFLKAGPMIVHNGFLATGVIYGIAGMVSFIFFLLTTLTYYLQKKLWFTNIGFMVVSILITFLIINMTQDFSFLGNQIGLFLGLLIGAALSLSSYSESLSSTSPTQRTIEIRQVRQANP